MLFSCSASGEGAAEERGRKPPSPLPGPQPLPAFSLDHAGTFFPINTPFLAGQRAGVPLWPVVCPVPQGGGEVKSWQSGERCKKWDGWQPRSGRKTLYFPGALWHLSPEQSGGRKYARQLARPLMPPTKRALQTRFRTPDRRRAGRMTGRSPIKI